MCVSYGHVGEEAIVRSMDQEYGGPCSNTQPMPLDSLKAMSNSRKKKNKFDRVDFLGDCITAFRKGVHTDVIVKPGDDGPGIPAHKAILVTFL